MKKIMMKRLHLHVVRYSSVRTSLGFAFQEGMVVYQMDVVTAFLNGVLDEEIYMVQPP